MNQPAETLRVALSRAQPLLERITEERSRERPGTMRWSRREILGHLIDSASNNHQRFVRAQVVGGLDFPGYVQDPWVALQGYAEENWRDLLTLWSSFNRHLVHVIDLIPEERAGIVVIVGESDGGPKTLRDLAVEYVEHLEHHLKQILP